MAAARGPVPAGSFLLSVPQLQDPNFMHSVVVMVDHQDQGAFGLVVNRPLGLFVERLLPDSELLAGTRFPVYVGGPVGNDALQFLHRVPDALPDGVEVAPGLFLGGHADDLERAIASGAATQRDLRLFVGYSGWGAGQLDAELESGSWVVAPGPPDWVFDERTSEQMWRHVLRSLGRDGEDLARMPPDVTWN